MQSSIKFRPRSFSDIIGQDKTLKTLRGLYKKNNFPQTLMFTGPKGSGKTSLARIIALSVQCKHTEFGEPCKACRQEYTNLPIYELSCARIESIQDVKNFVNKSEFEIVGRGNRKVFILDEMHRLSPQAQDVLLAPFEQANKNLWIITTNKAEKVADTIRSRAQIFNMRVFTRDNIAELVKRLLTKLKSELSVDDLADALIENGIVSARMIANAVDKYVAGDSSEEAAQVEGVATLNGKAIIRAGVKGDWPDVSALLKKTAPGDVRLLRASIIGYLHTVLLESSEINDRSKTVAKAIKQLSYVNQAEDSNQLAALSSELLTVCALFRKYPL